MSGNYRIESIALKQVGAFDDVQITFPAIDVPDLAEIHIFTGPNGCGKSTLLYALARIFQGYDDNLIRPRFRGEESCAKFSFGSARGCYGVRPPPGRHFQDDHYDSNRRVFLFTDRLSQNGEGLRSVYGYSGLVSHYSRADRLSWPPLPFAVFAYSGQRTLVTAQIEAIREITNSPFENAVSFDRTVRPQVLLQWIANTLTKAILARHDGDTRDAERYDLALDRITRAIRDICNQEVTFKLERFPLSVVLLINGEKVPFDTLPDGLKSILAWIGDLSLRLEGIVWGVERDIFAQPIILFLDEVDIHLHPDWQRRILPAIQTLLPNAQVLVSTHSPFVVGSVANAWVYSLPKPGTAPAGEPLVIEPIPSGAGKSYRLILDETFGISREFDEVTSKQFEAFYEILRRVPRDPDQIEILRQFGEELAKRGEEVNAIVQSEIRQQDRLRKLRDSGA